MLIAIYRILGFLRRNLSACLKEVEEAAYRKMVYPVLEYGSSVCEHPDPPCKLLQNELEKVQKKAASFVTVNYIYLT